MGSEPGPTILGVHHVRIPVSEVMRSRDWYREVFAFEPLLTVEEEDHVIGVVVGHASGVTLGLHVAPELARALEGFCVLALSIAEVADLTGWSRHLDSLHVGYSGPTEGHVGWYLEVPDPDGILVELHTMGRLAADEA
jgi:catechol 2,3-dioxygenase-like lactoylglutathione lyase family enzyme